MTEQEARDQYAESLGTVKIMGHTFDAADVLEEMDYVAYQEDFTNWCDAMGYDWDNFDQA